MSVGIDLHKESDCQQPYHNQFLLWNRFIY